MIERFITLFGSTALECLTADREFVGEKWIKYLNEQRIRYYIRIRENFWVLQPHNGKKVKASWLFADLPLNGCRVNHRIVYLNNQLCYLSASKVKDKDGKPELQVIVSFNKPEDALEIYKEILKKDPNNSDAKIAIRRLSGMRKKFLGVNNEMKAFFVQMDEEAEFIQFERWLLRAWN